MVPVAAIGGFVAFVYLFRRVYGGIPLMTKVYHRERARGVNPKLIAFLDWWEVHGPFPVMVGVDGGVRDMRDQKRLWAKGRTVSSGIDVTPERPLGRTVTNAETNVQSAHGHAAGLDLWPVNNLGRPQFNLKDPVILARYAEIGRLAKAQGLEWGGDWPEPKTDRPHVQIRGWAALPVIVDKSALA